MISSVLGEWREGKVRPVPGNAPHNRLVSRGISLLWSICDDPFSATRFPQLLRTIPGAWYAFSEACGIYLVRWGPKTKIKTNPWVGTVPPPDGRPRAQVKERAGRITLFLIVRR